MSLVMKQSIIHSLKPQSNISWSLMYGFGNITREILLNFTLNWTHVQIKIENPNPYFLCSRIFSIDKFSIFYLQWNWIGRNWTDKFRFNIHWNFGKMKQNRTLKFSIDTSFSEENKVTSFSMCNTELNSKLFQSQNVRLKMKKFGKCQQKNERKTYN